MAESLENIVQLMKDPFPGVNLKKFHGVVENSNVSSADAKAFVASFKPTNEFEKTIKVKLINKFQLYSEVEKLLKEGDAHYVGGALKCTWFFEDIHVDNVKDFFDDLFPCLSYTARLKVIHKFSKCLKNEEKCDKLFNLIKARYGVSAAFELLPACSEDLIAELLYALKKPLRKPIAKALYSKHTKLFQAYLLFLLECRCSGKANPSANIHEYDEIFRTMASNETDTFLKLFDKYGEHFPWMNLGRGVTKKLVKKGFPTILKHSSEIKRFFKMKILKKTLSLNNVKELHFALLPKDISNLKTIISHRYGDKEFISVLSDIKGTLGGEIFLSNFKKAYGKDLLESRDVINHDLAVLLPKDVRCAWALTKFSDADEINRKAEFIAYLDPDDALPKLKQLISSQTEIQGRVHIVKCMFTCLKVNKAEHKVGDVLTFITSRLRNDQSNIREKALDELTANFDLSKLSSDDWKIMENLLNLVSINREQDHLQYYILQILEKWIEHKVTNNMDPDELLQKLVGMVSTYYKFDLCSGTPNAKMILLWFIKNLPPKLNDKNRTTMGVNLFSQICLWNKSNPSDKITLPEWIFKEIKGALCEASYQTGIIMEALKGDQELLKTLVDELFPTLCSPKILISKLKEDPQNISNDLEKIMNSVMKQDVKEYLPFFKKLKMYTHSGLTTKVVEICNANLHEGSGFRKTWNSIILLSYFVPAQVFIQIITPYYPKSSTIEDFSDGGHSVFDIQKQIALSLKNLNPPSEMLEPMRKFCTGDYLKLVVGSLYSLCLKCSEQLILPKLASWLDCAVSQRKHYLRAYCKVAPMNDALDLLENSFVNEKNTSLRVLIFDNIFKFFVDEPSLKILQTLKHVVEAFSSDDQEPLKKLYSVSLIPTNFISEYINMLWGINIDQSNNKKMRVISLIDSGKIMYLSSDQCENIIKLLLCDDDEEFQSEVIRFCVDYIFCDGIESSSQISRLSKVVEIFLKDPENLHAYNIKRNSVFLHKRLLSTFLKQCCRKSFVDPLTKSNNAVLLHLASYLKKDNLRSMFFKELLYLECSAELAQRKHVLDCDFVHFLSGKIVTSFNDVGGELLPVMVDVIQDLVSLDPESSQPREIVYLKLAKSLIKVGAQPNVQVVAIKLLPNKISECSANEHVDLLSHLLCLKDNKISIFVNEYLKNLSSDITG